MRSDSYPASHIGDHGPGSPARTFTEEARRAQLVNAAISVLAEVGFERASLARIAAAAGASKGVVSYHFAGKEELLSEVVTRVNAEAEAFMLPRIFAEASALGRLEAYIRANLAFMDERRDELAALVEIIVHTEEPNPYAAHHARAVQTLAEGLAAGQRAGELGDFDARIFALALRAAIDAVPAQLRLDPRLDVGAVGDELSAIFARAARP